MSAETFTQNIIEHAQPFFFEEPAILIRHDDSWNFAGLQFFDISDRTSWIIFGDLIFLTISLILLIDKIILSQETSLIQSLSNAVLIIIGVILGKG